MKKLKQIKDLFDVGVLTKSEYEVQKAKCLFELGLGKDLSPDLSVSTNIDPLASQNQTKVEAIDTIEEITDPLIDVNPLSKSHPTKMEVSAKKSVLNPLSQNQGTRVGLSQLSIGQYEILSLIDEGGMGIVYRARHKNKRIAAARGNVAIKLIKSEYIKNQQLREIRTRSDIGNEIVSSQYCFST